MMPENIMPERAQATLIVIASVFIAVAIARAFYLLRRENDERLLIMIGCGAAASLLEGFACHLIQCYHSPVGMIEVYEVFNIHVPLWLALVYVLFFGVTPYLFLKSFSRSPKASTLWRTYLIVGLTEGFGEMLAIHLGTHTYHGAQPLSIFGFPIYLGFLNSSLMLITALIAAHWFDAVRGTRRYGLIVLTPPIMAAVYAGLTFPTIAFLHEGDRTLSNIGSLGTIVLSLLSVAYIAHRIPRFAKQYARAS